MRNEPSYKDIFVAGGYPKYTYNPRKRLALEEKINEILQNLCKLAIVTGHTKSGKTVLVLKTLPRNKAIWIDGGAISNEEDFWTEIINQLELHQRTEDGYATGKSSEVSTEGSVEGNALLAKVGGKASGRINNYKETNIRQSRTISSKVTALTGLRNSHIPLVIDDFHYLPKELQGNVIRALKPLIFEGLPVVVIAIPHRRYDAVKVEKEMTGRILPVNVPIWSIEELSYIPKTGFDLLNIKLDSIIIERLAGESIGSPHLMQEFCRELCKVSLSKGTLARTLTPSSIDTVFRETANSTIGRPIFEKLARGPRQRADRIRRKLKTGEKVDIYGLVLGGLAHLKPGLTTLEYEDLRTAIREICIPENVPNLQEVARVLKHMRDIAATDQSSTPVIDFDEEDKRLHITDPFFAFYLRWGDINK